MSRADARDFEVAIVGTGFSGLAVGHYLKQAGIESFVLLEKAAEVGGTWRENTYPGAACDVMSHLYSFSFAPNPRWSRVYSPQPEILAYLKRVAANEGLLPHCRFHAEVRGADFDEASGRWTVRLADGSTVRARSLMLGNGGLHLPATPELPGRERFEGPAFHSACWDHGVDLRGKRVGVIGTGASAIQIVPSIAAQVAQLHVFQRSPAWVVPRLDRAYTPLEQAIFARLPLARRAQRAAIYWRNELTSLAFVRGARFAKLAERMGVEHLRASVPDPALRSRLTPSYRLGCKRVLVSNDYFPAFLRPNVELVSEGIAELTARGVRTVDGRERDLDVLVCCTGFRTNAYLSKLEVRGAGGRELNETWHGAPETFLGLTVSGFPNLCLLMGPNTGLGSSSMVFMIEAQARYAVQCVRALRERALVSLDVRAEVQRAYDEEIQRKLRDTIWASGCTSWYQAPDGRIVALWPGLTLEYWARTRRLELDDYVQRR